MRDFFIVWILLAGIPLGLALLCSAIQRTLAARPKGSALRRSTIPTVFGAVTLYLLFRTVTETGWDVLEWGIYLFWSGSALIGTLFGWAIGSDKRKKQDGLAKEE